MADAPKPAPAGPPDSPEVVLPQKIAALADKYKTDPDNKVLEIPAADMADIRGALQSIKTKTPLLYNKLVALMDPKLFEGFNATDFEDPTKNFTVTKGTLQKFSVEFGPKMDVLVREAKPAAERLLTAVHSQLDALRRSIDRKSAKEERQESLKQFVAALKALRDNADAKEQWQKMEAKLKLENVGLLGRSGDEIITNLETADVDAIGTKLVTLANEISPYPAISPKERTQLSINRINLQIDRFVDRIPAPIFQALDQWLGIPREEASVMLVGFIKTMLAEMLSGISNHADPNHPMSKLTASLAPKFWQIGKGLHWQAAKEQYLGKLPPVAVKKGPPGKDPGVLPSPLDSVPDLRLPDGCQDRWDKCYDRRMDQVRTMNAPNFPHATVITPPPLPTIEEMATDAGMEKYKLQLDDVQKKIEEAQKVAVAASKPPEYREGSGFPFPKDGTDIVVGTNSISGDAKDKSGNVKRMTVFKRGSQYIVKVGEDKTEVILYEKEGENPLAAKFYWEKDSKDANKIEIRVNTQATGATLVNIVDEIVKDQSNASRKTKGIVNTDGKLELKN